MSGHSKWSTIKHQKEATDKKRSQQFSKIAKLITIAVKESGNGDPVTNSHLRLAIDQAKAINMPKDNIKRAIDRGLGIGTEGQLQSITYEGFGPDKVAVLVECITDNKNRAAAEIKSLFERVGGNLGGPGSVSYLFARKGLMLIEKGNDWETQVLKLIDLGVDDVEEEGGHISVYIKPELFEESKNKIVASGFILKESSLIYKPTSQIILSNAEKKNKLLSFLEALEDFDDVENVYCNAGFTV